LEQKWNKPKNMMHARGRYRAIKTASNQVQYESRINEINAGNDETNEARWSEITSYGL